MIIVCVLAFLILFFYFYKREHKVYGEIKRTTDEKKKGIMYRKYKLKNDEGMLFVYDYKNNSMWMKNTYIPLDIIFLDNNMSIVGYVKDTVPLSLKGIKINKKSSNVLEMNSGSIENYNMSVGDKIKFIERELS